MVQINYNKETIKNVANMYMATLDKFLPESNKSHKGELMILNASRMAGTLMFHSLIEDALNSQPPSLLSVNAKAKVHDLTQFAGSVLEALGGNIDFQKSQAHGDVFVTVLQKYPLSKTHETFSELFILIAKTVGISYAEAALASSYASAYMVYSHSQFLDIHRGFLLAVSGHNEALTYLPSNIKKA